MKKYNQKDCTVLIHGVWARVASRCHNIKLMTCVELVKHVLGISETALLTPFQLYRYLVEHAKFEPVSLSGYAHALNVPLTIPRSRNAVHSQILEQ